MSKALFICFNDPGFDLKFYRNFNKDKINLIWDRLTPDNITPNHPLQVMEKGVIITVFNC